jgi:hypothetical protein
MPRPVWVGRPVAPAAWMARVHLRHRQTAAKSLPYPASVAACAAGLFPCALRQLLRHPCHRADAPHRPFPVIADTRQVPRDDEEEAPAPLPLVVACSNGQGVGSAKAAGAVVRMCCLACGARTPPRRWRSAPAPRLARTLLVQPAALQHHVRLHGGLPSPAWCAGAAQALGPSISGDRGPHSRPGATPVVKTCAEVLIVTICSLRWLADPCGMSRWLATKPPQDPLF